MLDQLCRDIQTRLDELLGEADKLRRALFALGSREDDGALAANGAPAPAPERERRRARSATPAGTTTPKSARPRPSAGTGAPSSSPLAAEPPAVEPHATEFLADEPSAAARPRGAGRPARGATKHAVLAALAGGNAMTAGELVSGTGLGRASVSTTLSKLAKSGELTKAARGYQIASVEPAQRFYSRTEDSAPGAVLANLPELEAELATCDAGVLRHHCAEHDFSRWVAGVFHNDPLAADIAAAEAQLSAASPTDTVEHVRLALIAALQARHATQR